MALAPEPVFVPAGQSNHASVTRHHCQNKVPQILQMTFSSLKLWASMSTVTRYNKKCMQQPTSSLLQCIIQDIPVGCLSIRLDNTNHSLTSTRIVWYYPRRRRGTFNIAHVFYSDPGHNQWPLLHEECFTAQELYTVVFMRLVVMKFF